ncbi:MAG TPA: Rrf2 family transcriptional regulator [Casimicrobiaceae bacterium]|nr:Rrf2 family transcriptional regulator [Casimicrobiaceae bacterium]
MRLTTFSDYSLRVLMYLGTHEDRLATIGEIAQAYDISENHLMKVVHYLAQTGYVETTRGRGGGMRLARPPRDINLGKVVRGTEDRSHLVECFDPLTSGCRIAPGCTLKGLLGQALEAFFHVLDGHTLADLLVTRPRLVQLLAVPGPGATAAPSGGRAARGRRRAG